MKLLSLIPTTLFLVSLAADAQESGFPIEEEPSSPRLSAASILQDAALDCRKLDRCLEKCSLTIHEGQCQALCAQKHDPEFTCPAWNPEE